jgi:membrane protein
MSPGAILDLLKAAFRQYQGDHGEQLAASLSFYTALSIGPLLTMLIALLSAAIGPATAERRLLEQVTNLMGPQVTEFVEQMIRGAGQKPAVGGFARLLELLVLFWGSTKVFLELQNSLNLVWNVKPRQGKMLPQMLLKRLFSFGLVLALGFLILVSLTFSAGISMLLQYADWLGPDAAWIWLLVNLWMTLMGSILLFGLLFKTVPDTDVSWRVAWLGAGVTSVLFTLGTVVMKAFLGAQGAPYGVSGSLIVFLLWVFYSAQILFFGAELTQVYSIHVSSDG